MSGPVGPVECGNAGSMQAYRSLAKHCGVDLHDVIVAARADALGDLMLETRGAASRRGGLDPVVALETLARRMRLSLLSDRAALLGT